MCGDIRPMPDINCSGATRDEFMRLVYLICKRRPWLVVTHEWERDYLSIQHRDHHDIPIKYSYADFKHFIRHYQDEFWSDSFLETCLQTVPLNLQKPLLAFPIYKAYKNPTMKIKKVNTFTLNPVEVKKILTDYLKDKKLLDRAGVLSEKVTVTLTNDAMPTGFAGALNRAETMVTIKVEHDISYNLITPSSTCTAGPSTRY